MTVSDKKRWMAFDKTSRLLLMAHECHRIKLTAFSQILWRLGHTESSCFSEANTAEILKSSHLHATQPLSLLRGRKLLFGKTTGFLDHCGRIVPDCRRRFSWLMLIETLDSCQETMFSIYSQQSSRAELMLEAVRSIRMGDCGMGGACGASVMSGQRGLLLSQP